MKIDKKFKIIEKYRYFFGMTRNDLKSLDRVYLFFLNSENRYPQVSFSHIYHEVNTGADWMAKLDCPFRTCSLSVFSSWPCMEFLCILVDNLGKTLVKMAK